MTLVDEVYAHARVLAPRLNGENQPILEAVCRSATVSLRARLRDNLTVEDCKADFVTAASMLALSAMPRIDDLDQLEMITAGDLTLRRGSSDMASECLRAQAELLMAPYVKDPFVFVGV